MSDIGPNSAARTVLLARLQAQLSQRELAQRAGTTQATIARIEAGHTSPTVATLTRLVAAAGFDISIEISAKHDQDAVIEAYKRDIDRTLLRENLKKTPDQRVQNLKALQRFAREIRRAGRTAKRQRVAQ